MKNIEKQSTYVKVGNTDYVLREALKSCVRDTVQMAREISVPHNFFRASTL